MLFTQLQLFWIILSITIKNPFLAGTPVSVLSINYAVSIEKIADLQAHSAPLGGVL